MPHRPNNQRHLKPYRQALRATATPAERRLWLHLKNNQLLGRKFRRQFSVQNYILDFYCPAEQLAVELDGSHQAQNCATQNPRFQSIPPALPIPHITPTHDFRQNTTNLMALLTWVDIYPKRLQGISWLLGTITLNLQRFCYYQHSNNFEWQIPKTSEKSPRSLGLWLTSISATKGRTSL